MERFAIKIDKKLRANLYKICRLCGMDNPDMVPILSNNDKSAVVDVEAEMEMSQKINLLIGLSVTKDDRMPQTMCGLCVDKINDFYEFREMCYATNTQTRKLLGLKAIKKSIVDTKPKVEVKQEEEIVPTPISSKNANRKRKIDDMAMKEELPANTTVLSKKKLRFSAPAAEAVVKEEVLVATKKKLRFTALNDEITGTIPVNSNKLKKEPTPPIANSNKKTKLSSSAEDKLKKELSPLTATPVATAVSNKKLRLVAPAQKETASKKPKQKSNKNLDAEVKEEIKEEIKEEPSMVPATTSIGSSEALSSQKLKFGCNICSERFQSKGKLEAHARSVHLPKIERYVCTACNEVLSKSFDIKNHQLWHKLSKTPYVCGCCGESILNTYAFSRHLREHAFETPPALLVLDRECPQCHISYATNFLYNIHLCAVKTRRCAGCNRLQRNEAEYLRHSAQCAKVYLNYSKHIMPSVEALEDTVRIKNENDVEAAAEEMARISGVSLDMAPVVQLTRLSSPIIMAATQCVSIAGLDDIASTSSKKSGKKGVSKKDLKRVDELLKSTLDALVSIKHEPEVHVEQETPSSGEHSDNDDHPDVEVDHDVFHHNDDSDNDNGNENITETNENEKSISEEGKQIKIKQEFEEGYEENSNKIGFGLKLKIKKEHGQLNSSIIEQQKSTEKRAEKRKKKKKHKDKEKDKQKLSKDMQDEQLSQDSYANNNADETIIRIKTEPPDGTNAVDMVAVAPLQVRPQPEATIMTSIPMMQFQIACVSSGVDFNNSSNQQTALALNQEAEKEDVKPNRAELDRIMQISHVSSGVAMETDETEAERKDQTMEHDLNDNADDCREDNKEDDNHDGDESEHSDGQEDEKIDEQEENEETDVCKRDENREKVVYKNKPKQKATFKPKDIQVVVPILKSRNKACKSTAKSANIPILQISAVQSGVELEPSLRSSPDESNSVAIFIKPEPQNRGYSDEQSTTTLDIVPAISEQTYGQTDVSQTHSSEEQNYISSIDFNNIVIKQEKGIEINDVQVTKKLSKSYADFNGVKRKRRQIRYSHTDTDNANEKEENNDSNYDEDLENDGYEETDDEAEEAELEEEEDEESIDEEEEEEDQVDESEEEREYRELEYPPQMTEINTMTENKENHLSKENEGAEDVAEGQENQQQNAINESVVSELTKGIEDNSNIQASRTQSIEPSNEMPAFIISSVCSQAATETEKPKEVGTDNNNLELVGSSHALNTSDSSTAYSKAMLSKEPNTENSKRFCTTVQAEIISETNEHESLKTIPTTLSKQATLPSPASKISDSERHIPQITLKSDLQQHEVCDILTNPTKQNQFIIDHEAQSAQNNQGLIEEKQIVLENRCNVPEIQPLASSSKIADQQATDSHDIQSNYEEQSIQTDKNYALSLDSKFYNNDQQHNLTSNTVSKLEYAGNIQYDKQQMIQGGEVDNENLLHTELNSESAASQRLLTQVDETTLLTAAQSFTSIPSGATHEIQQIPEQVKTQTLKDEESVLQILSVTTLESENDDKDIVKCNQQETTETIKGFVGEFKYQDLEVQHATETSQHNNCQNEDINDNDMEEDNNEDHNLEEQQNYQNQEVLSQIRPAALALHPYLEDISSSSNSLLSNSLSQTPPPPSPSITFNTATAREQLNPQQILNNEETENILNESNDVFSRRSMQNVTATSASNIAQPPLGLHSNLAQQLPTNMRTFNFDNINEIAENNNNANIEREQLQDEQQEQVSNNVI